MTSRHGVCIPSFLFGVARFLGSEHGPGPVPPGHERAGSLRRIESGILRSILLPGLLAACGTLPNGRRWGEDATPLPGWQRVGEAALHSAVDPLTWAPLAGALALQIDHWDTHLSNWASRRTPVFGSKKRALRATGPGGNLSDAAYVITALATPGGAEPLPWIWSKFKGIAVGAGARTATLLSTDLLKDAAGRGRPSDPEDKRSFPSQHASRLGVNYTLASRNLRSIPLGAPARTTLNVGFGFLAVLGAWSRVEAAKHYPSDVLAGLALGHFLGAFFNDAFLGLEDSKVRLEVMPLQGGVAVGCSIRF